VELMRSLSFARVLKSGSGEPPSNRGAPLFVAGVCWIYYMYFVTCSNRRFAVTTRIILKLLFRCALVAPRQGGGGGQAGFVWQRLHVLCDERVPSIN
jgi:hypothetical protein